MANTNNSIVDHLHNTNPVEERDTIEPYTQKFSLFVKVG
jgi:hypothetical protein